MTETKFRTWGKPWKAWLDPRSVCIRGDGEIFINGRSDDPANWDIEWFTGLTDANGQEIYEGDIISNGDPADDAVVVWNDDECAWALKVIRSSGTMDLIANGLDRSVDEVIGNIHETPELLEAA